MVLSSRLTAAQSSMPTLIKTALRQDEFFMLYQPVVELQTGRWIGAEALIRWRRSDGSLMRPDLFIPMAEEAGLITKITERVTELIARDAAGLFAKYPEFHLALNLSAADIHAEQTQSLLQALAQATRAKPGNLVTEATERGFMDADRARAMLHKLHQDGVSDKWDGRQAAYQASAKSIYSLRTRSSVASDRSTCPPWATSSRRATRLRGGPK